MQILPILDKIIVQPMKKKKITNFKKLTAKKFQFFNYLWQKKVQNLTIFSEIIAHLRNQIAKNQLKKKKKKYILRQPL